MKLPVQTLLNKKWSNWHVDLLEEWEELPPVFVSSSVSGLGKEEILNYIGTVLQNL